MQRLWEQVSEESKCLERNHPVIHQHVVFTVSPLKGLWLLHWSLIKFLDFKESKDSQTKDQWVQRNSASMEGFQDPQQFLFWLHGKTIPSQQEKHINRDVSPMLDYWLPTGWEAAAAALHSSFDQTVRQASLAVYPHLRAVPSLLMICFVPSCLGEVWELLCGRHFCFSRYLTRLIEQKDWNCLRLQFGNRCPLFLTLC